MKTPLRLILFLTALLIMHTAAAQTIRTSFIPQLNPFSYVDSDGSPSGFYIELLEAMARDIGFELSYVEGSWGENFELGRNGELDLLIAVAYTPERREFLDYLDEPVASAYSQVIRRRGAEIESVLDLNARRVGIMRGDSNGQGFLEFVNGFELDLEVMHYEDYPALLSAISTGEVDAGAIINLYNLDDYPDIARTSIVFNAYSTSFATAKGTNAELMSELNSRLVRWKADPNSPYYEIFSHYFGGDSRQPIPAGVITGMIFLLLSTIGALIIVQILTRRLRKANAQLEEWNSTLEQRVQARSLELEESRGKLLEAEKMAALGNMVAGVAHEINTPIGVALTAASYIRDHVSEISRQFRSDKLSREDFDVFLENSMNSAEMVSGNLLRAASLIQSFKEISIDQVRGERRPINIKEYGESVLRNLYPRIKGSGHEYRFEADNQVIVTDPGSIAQIITNLFENALVHGLADRDNGRIDIEMRLRRDPDPQVHLRFSDNGCGVDEAIRENMFEPFVSTRKFQGSSGLGLSIIHNIITKKLSGEISVHSDRKTGTEFRIIFPCEIPE
jgi:signal transduction histidine kinase